MQMGTFTSKWTLNKTGVVDCTDLAQVRDMRWADVNAGMNIRVS
jgi:hypothetical protein